MARLAAFYIAQDNDAFWSAAARTRLSGGNATLLTGPIISRRAIIFHIPESDALVGAAGECQAAVD